MASFKPILLITAGMMVSFSANAFDLNGACNGDDRNCAKIFVKKNNKMSMTRKSDRFGGGFIVEGNQIRGQGRTYQIIGRKEEGEFLNLIAKCTTETALLDAQQITAKINGDDQLTRIYPSVPEAGTTYYRCKFR